MLSWLPETVSTYGPDIDRLFYVIYYVTVYNVARYEASTLADDLDEIRNQLQR